MVVSGNGFKKDVPLAFFIAEYIERNGYKRNSDFIREGHAIDLITYFDKDNQKRYSNILMKLLDDYYDLNKLDKFIDDNLIDYEYIS